MKRFVFVCALISVFASFSAAAEFAWVEAEKPADSNFKWKSTGWPAAERFSGDAWLLQTDRKNLDDAGLQLQYDVNVPKDGAYDVWLRIGYEWIRPKVAWQFDGGKWTTVGLGKPPAGDTPAGKVDYHRLATNVKGLADWTEVSWWNVGTATLKAGKRKLNLKFTRTEQANPLLALDAVCLVAGKWTPEGRLKPGEQYAAEDDRKAAAQVFRLPEPDAASRRVGVQLNGLWQISRHDEPDMDVAPTAPLAKMPPADELHWMGIAVPDSLWKHPETTLAHRVIYRTKVDVPAAHKGRGFKLHFSGTNWIASVFVNGQLAREGPVLRDRYRRDGRQPDASPQHPALAVAMDPVDRADLPVQQRRRCGVGLRHRQPGPAGLRRRRVSGRRIRQDIRGQGTPRS